MRLVIACLAFILLGTPSVSSQEQLGDPALRGLAIDGPLPSVAVQLIAGGRSWSDEGIQTELLNALVKWLHDGEGLPAALDRPRIAYASASSIAAIRYRSFAVLQQHQRSIAATAIRDTTVALYVDAERSIYLLDGFKAQTPEELSVLVHELVHHIQNVTGRRYECPQAREREAYIAQERWLRQFGTSLAEKFEVDPFTVLVNGLCVY